MGVAQAKGSAFVPLHAFLEERADASRLRVALQRHMPEASRDALEHAIAVGWYPLEVYFHAIRALGPTLDLPPEEAARIYGRYSAEHDLTRIHRLFLRLANPAYVLEKAGEYWSRYFDTGRWTVRRESPTRAHAELADFGGVDAIYCEALTAYIKRMFELAGAKDVRVAHPRCRARLAEACAFAIEWR